MVNVRYGNTICMQLCLHIEQCLKHRGHFLKYEVWIKQTGILSVLCGSVYLSLVMNSTGLIFKSKTLYTSSFELAAMKSCNKPEFLKVTVEKDIATRIPEHWNKMAFMSKDKKCRRNSVRNVLFLFFYNVSLRTISLLDYFGRCSFTELELKSF